MKKWPKTFVLNFQTLNDDIFQMYLNRKKIILSQKQLKILLQLLTTPSFKAKER